MTKIIVVATIAVAALLFATQPVQAETLKSGRYVIEGPASMKKLDKKLVKNIFKMLKHFKVKKATITPHGACRKRGSRQAPNSFHKYSRGCKAADIIVPGYTKVKGRRALLAWWSKNVGGGTGYYRNKRFVHVDVGPKRKWSW